MKFLLTFFFSVLLFSLSFAQDQPSKHDLSPCGSVAEKSPWLSEFQKRAPHEKKVVSANQMIYVPLSVHLVSRDNGFGGMDEEDALQALCTLNEDFVPANIQFYLEGGFQYLPDTELYSHETVTEGGLKMLEYNIPNTFNCYLVSSAARNCGYNLPYAGVANAFQCLGPDDHTWAHEMGHGFTLPHPFLGWEGGVSHDNSVPHSYGVPAPDSVFFDYSDFQDTLYLGTERIISVAPVEKVDGSNCLEAADGFCDTSPDYLSIRWDCTGDIVSQTEQTDPNGEKFVSDASLIMSYAFDACSSRFSDDQIEAMRANIAEEYPIWLDTELPFEPFENEFVYNSPINGDLVQYDDVTLAWEPLGEGAYYKVEVSFINNFSFTDYKGIITENELTLNNLQADRTYYWRVLAFSDSDFCVNVSPTQTFETGDLVAVKELSNLGEFQIFPNPLVKNNAARISWDKPSEEALSVQVIDIHGRVVQELQEGIAVGSTHLDLKVDVPKGLYFLRLIADDGALASLKLVVD